MARDYRNFIYDENRRFIFAYVPKAACTNWKCLLRYMAGFDNWLDNKLAHDKVKGGLRYINMNIDGVALLTDPSIQKFTMVRDPYTRILSAYLNKVECRLPVKHENQGDYFDEVVRSIDQYRKNVFGDKKYPLITFEVFLRWIANEAGVNDGKERLRHDEHWVPQAVLLRQPKVKFDFIGRFENLEIDLKENIECNGM